MNLVGVVMAGGKSSRMGRDKASLTLKNGETALKTCFDKLADVTRVCVVASSRVYGGFPCVADARENSGPLGGVVAGLRYAHKMDAPGALVLACDLPRAPAKDLVALAALKPTPLAAAYANASTGKLELLAAFYSTRVLPALEDRLARGLCSLRLIARDLRFVSIPWRGDETAFYNLNYPEDLLFL